MLKKCLLIFAALLTFSFWAIPGSNARDSWQWQRVGNWEAKDGSYLMADLPNGKGYLINPFSRQYFEFPVISGQQKNVYYIGRYYFAATPERVWEVKEKNVQGDRITFGKTGEFLRLYYEGSRTPYGIHGHRYYDAMAEKDTVFQSMGCLIVSDDILDVIEASYNANGNRLVVVTTSGKYPLPF